jgi:hypothetical protein
MPSDITSLLGSLPGVIATSGDFVQAVTQPSQFDSSANYATTEFVGGVGLKFAGQGTITADTELLPTQAGSWFDVSGKGLTVTLPQSQDVPVGSTFSFVCRGPGFVLEAAGLDVIFPALPGGATSSFVSLASETFTVANLGSGLWQVVSDGFGSGSFSSSLTATGWQRTPGGRIAQWGTAVLSASNTATPVPFIIPFTDRFLGGQLTIFGAAPLPGSTVSFSVGSLTGFNGFNSALSGSQTVSWAMWGV